MLLTSLAVSTILICLDLAKDGTLDTVPIILICLDLAKDGTLDVTNESSCSYNTDLFRSG